MSAVLVAVAVSTASLGATSNLTYLDTYSDGLGYPARLAAAPGGGVYVTDPPLKQVVHYDADGDVVAAYTIAQGPVGIAAHPDGRIFISRNDGAIGVYSSAFVLQGTVSAAPFTLTGPNDLVFDSDALELYTVDSGSHRVLVFIESAPGTWTVARSWGMEGVGLGQFAAPQSIALDTVEGRVIVTDADNFRVQVFDTTGVLLFKFGYRILFLADSDTAWFARSEGVAVDACGNIHIVDALMGTLRVFSGTGAELNGMHVPSLGYGTAAGQLRVPCDVLIDGDTLYVANTNNGTVEVFDVACSLAVTAGVETARIEPAEKPLRAQRLQRYDGMTPRVLRRPDSPLDVVAAIDAGEYSHELDLNQDQVLNRADIDLAVQAFGVGSTDDFLASASEHPPLDEPHILDLPNRCGRCHSMDGAPGGILTATGQENLCQSCHSAGKIAGKKWIGAGDLGNSHPWGMAADDLDPQSDLALHLDDGDVRCGTCHDPHNSAGGQNYMRTGPLYDETTAIVTGLNPPAPRAMTAMNPMLCGECHADIVEEWHVAGHSHEEADPFVHYDWAASNRATCRRCHSGFGYIDFAAGVAEAQQRGKLRVVDCLVCHSTHGAAQDETLLRIYDEVMLPSNQLITEAGPGATCIACHNGRRQPPIPNPPGVTTIHYLSGGVMLEGINGVTNFNNTEYTLTSSNHTTNSAISCTACHMAPGPSDGENAGTVGGHTFRLKNHETGYENVGTTCATAACHPGLTTINRPANGDYDGDGVIEGVQDETTGLLALVEAAIVGKGAVRLPSNPYWQLGVCAGGSRNGLACTPNLATDSCITSGGVCNSLLTPSDLATQLTVEDAIWNLEYVENSGDLGVKNTGYAIGLLQIAYKGVTGNAVPGAAYRYSPAP